jgi:tetratricopeptide (TPR) repeat protein
MRVLQRRAASRASASAAFAPRTAFLSPALAHRAQSSHRRLLSSPSDESGSRLLHEARAAAGQGRMAEASDLFARAAVQTVGGSGEVDPESLTVEVAERYLDAAAGRALALASTAGGSLRAVAVVSRALRLVCGGDSVGSRVLDLEGGETDKDGPAKIRLGAAVGDDECALDEFDDAIEAQRDEEEAWMENRAVALLVKRLELLRVAGNILKSIPRGSDAAQQYLRAAERLNTRLRGSPEIADGEFENLARRLRTEIGECFLQRASDESSGGDPSFSFEAALECFGFSSGGPDEKSTAVEVRDVFGLRNLMNAATALRGLGRLEESSEQSQRAASGAQNLAREMARGFKKGKPPTEQDLSALHLLARHEFSAHQRLAMNSAAEMRFDDAAAHFRRALGAADRMALRGSGSGSLKINSHHSEAAEMSRRQASQALVQALQAAGRTSEAQSLLEEESERTRGSGDARSAQESIMSAARMALESDGSDGEKAENLRMAARAAREAGSALAEASAKFHLGQLLLSKNDPEGARLVLLEALRLVEDGDAAQREVETSVLLLLSQAELDTHDFESTKKRLHLVMARQEAEFDRSQDSNTLLGLSGAFLCVSSAVHSVVCFIFFPLLSLTRDF